MSRDEVVIRIIGKLGLVFPDINQQEVRNILEEVLYNYNVTPVEKSVALLDNMDDRILLYLASKKIDGLSENTLKSYGRNLRRFANAIRKNVEDINAMDIRVYLANFSRTGVKNTTLSTETDILRGFFTWLENEDYILKSPMKKIKSVKVEKRIRQALNKEEFEILRGGAKTLRQKALLELLYSTGCRLEEIERMEKSDIDWQKLQIRVIGKGNKERIVFLNSIAKVHLKKYLMSRLDECNSVFVTERKPYKFMGKRAIQREIDKIMMQSGLQKNVYPHLIRHTMATHLLNAGMDITVLQEILGHEDTSTTLVYASIDNRTVEHQYRKYS